MQVQKEVREHHHDAIPPIDGHRMPENALPNLRVAYRIAESHDRVQGSGFRVQYDGLPRPLIHGFGCSRSHLLTCWDFYPQADA
jgi:hypothetical protein